MYEDKTLVCKECGNEFVFTAGEQEFYAEKGFTNDWAEKGRFPLNGRWPIQSAGSAGRRRRS